MDERVEWRTVEGAARERELHEALVSVVRWPEDEHSRVEAVGPTGVRSCAELLALEQFVDRLQNLRVQQAHRGFELGVTHINQQ